MSICDQQSLPGLEQYAVKKYAESLEMVPRALAQNAGVKVSTSYTGINHSRV